MYQARLCKRILAERTLQEIYSIYVLLRLSEFPGKSEFWVRKKVALEWAQSRSHQLWLPEPGELDRSETVRRRGLRIFEPTEEIEKRDT